MVNLVHEGGFSGFSEQDTFLEQTGHGHRRIVGESVYDAAGGVSYGGGRGIIDSSRTAQCCGA